MHMVDALRWSLEHSVPDCGAYVALPWVKYIVRYFEAAEDEWDYRHVTVIPLTDDAGLKPTFLVILRLLMACLNRGLLTGETTIEDMKRLIDLLDHPTLPALPENVMPEAMCASGDGPHGMKEVRSSCINDRDVLCSLDIPVLQDRGNSQASDWSWILNDATTKGEPPWLIRPLC